MLQLHLKCPSLDTGKTKRRSAGSVLFRHAFSRASPSIRNQSVVNQIKLHRCHLLLGIPLVGYPHPRIAPLNTTTLLRSSRCSFPLNESWIFRLLRAVSIVLQCLIDQEVSSVEHERSTGLTHILCYPTIRWTLKDWITLFCECSKINVSSIY